MRAAFFLGCCALSVGCVPSIQSKHPEAFPRLSEIAPQCEKPTSNQYAACEASAKILEAKDARKATVAFITNWDQSVFGYGQRAAMRSEQQADITGMIIYGNAQAKSAEAVKAISAKVLQSVYEKDGSDYSKKMLVHLELIEPASQPSFTAFQAAHVQALAP